MQRQKINELEKVFADFQNADKHGRVRINTHGAFRDIELNDIKLLEGKRVLLDEEDELQAIGILSFSDEENIWVATIEWANWWPE